MKTLEEIELQLSRIGIHNRFWCKPEVRELTRILSDDEVIVHAVNGRYEGGFAMLLTTDKRLLLVDKKIWFLNMEDVRFDMISEVDFTARLLDATLSVMTIKKVLRFTSVKQKQLRSLTSNLQQRVMELRQPNLVVQSEPALQQQFIPPPQQATQTPIQQKIPVLGRQSRIMPGALGRISRIGAYPTTSFTVQKRFSK